MRHWTSFCVCAHAIYDTATLDAISVDGNASLGCGSGQALLAAEESKRWRMSNAAPYRYNHCNTCLPCITDLAPTLNASTLHIFIRRNSSPRSLGRACELHWTTLKEICKNLNTTRTQHLTRNSRSASQTYTTRMLSACLWIFTKPFKHVLTSIQYQVFQDLQGPASSLRVGSSVRTSTRPLSVSLLHLCLRYLTCIQRR